MSSQPLPVVEVQSVLACFLGYLAVLVTPGPNMLAVASTAALRGQATALPLAGGIALGAGAIAALSGVVVGLGEALGVDAGQGVGRLIGALLLLAVAGSMLRPGAAMPAEAVALPSRRIRQGAMLGSGFLIAATNPVTPAYFAAQFLGPLRPAREGMGPLAVGLVVATLVLGFSILIATTLSRPAARTLLRHHAMQVRYISAGLLGVSAVFLAWPLLG